VIPHDPNKRRTGTRRASHWLDDPEQPRTADLAEWMLDFSYATNPLSMNGSRGNHRAHARAVREVRIVAMREAVYAGVPSLRSCQVALTWYVTTAGRRDAVNLAAVLKAMQDGLVDAGVVPDDAPDLMDTLMPRIVRVDAAQAWMELVIRRWEGQA
jgi:crossover junction endodeoxyribonuclease RusA